MNSTVISAWCNAVKKVLAIQSLSAAAERAFSLLKYDFGDLQDNALQDYISICCMV